MNHPIRKTWKTLHLTSPLMHGVDEEAKEAQELLTHNRFKDFRPGMIDGTWGEHSANATHRAKYWMGYSRRKIKNHQFGEFVRRYLLPPDHPQHLTLPKINQIRRAARLAVYRLAQKRRNSLANVQERAFAYNKSQMGYKEYPTGSNDNKAGAWYGANGVPWCAIWQTYSWVFGGGYSEGISWIRSHQWAFVPYIVAAARLHEHGLEVISYLYVKRGDPTAYDWNGDGEADHIEAFDEWISMGVSFWAVGGNTGPADASNGGEVAREVRYVSEVQAFMRVTA